MSNAYQVNNQWQKKGKNHVTFALPLSSVSELGYWLQADDTDTISSCFKIIQSVHHEIQVVDQ